MQTKNLLRRTLLKLAAAVALGLGAGSLATPALAADLMPIATPKLPAQKSIKIFGANIQYYEFGKAGDGKPTLVLLHGGGSSAAGDWGQVMPELAKTHHVLALDHLGFGKSDKPFIQYGIQTWVDFVGEFLREKGVKDGFMLAGESLGGWISAKYSIEALSNAPVPGPSFVLPKPGRLVLCDAAGYRDLMAPMFEKKAEGTGIGAGPSVMGQKYLLAGIFHAPKFSDEAAVRRGMAWSLAKGDSYTLSSFMASPAILNEAVDGQLGAINIPTLVVWGEHDMLVPKVFGERFAKDIAGAKLVLMPDTAHAPMIETPAAFLEAVRDFLKP
ncbi:MAG TPA: alpha/beta hydrolase [Burkholderiaceae bacterium]|jgi:pimeloyl-ACP methyl ester carboxylesterase